MFDSLMSLAEAVTSPEGGLSLFQRVCLKAFSGMPLDRAEIPVWRKATGRTGLSLWHRTYRPSPMSELWLYGGRRSGKTTLGSILTIWSGLQREVPAGQAWTIPVINPGLRQSIRVSLDYIRRKANTIPELQGMITDETNESLTFSTGVVVRVFPPDPRVIQGFTAPLIWLDECSGFRNEQAYSNLQDVLDAVRPSIATIEDSKVLLTTLPGPKAGMLYEKWGSRFDDPSVLVWKASSLEMNPTLANSEEVEKARKRPEHYDLFYSGNFVDSSKALIPGNVVDRAFARFKGREEIRADDPLLKGSVGALGCDFAASRDDSAACLCFRTPDDKLIIPWLRNWTAKPGQLHEVYSYLSEIGSACNAYRIDHGAGDQQSLAAAYQFLKGKGVAYERVISNGQGSEPMFDYLREQMRSGRLHIVDSPLVRQQLKALEERRGVGSYEVGAGHGKDDAATALACAVWRCGQFPAPREPIAEAVWAHDTQRVDPNKMPLGPNDEFYPESHRFGPARWWHRV